MPELNALYREYRDRVQFYVVYIQEAHPIDAWQLEANVKDDMRSRSPGRRKRGIRPRTCASRSWVSSCRRWSTVLTIASSAPTPGWPDRLYVIDRGGAIAYKSAAGPFGFKPADLEAAIKRILAAGSS